MEKIKGFVIDRLYEKSTWIGFLWLLSSFGVAQFTPEQTQAITLFGMALFGAKGLLPDKHPPGYEDKE